MKRILIIEDEPDLIKVLQIRLELSNYTVLIATDGRQGLEKAQKEKPDLIILDLMLPKMDGYTVCGLLKADTRYNKIPIIILTGKAQETDKQMGLEVGANLFLAKPYESKILLAEIKKLLGGE